MTGIPSHQRQQQSWQARPRALSVGVRETCDAIDAAERDILEARGDAEASRSARPIGTAISAGGAAVGVGSALVAILGGGGPGIPFAIIGGLVGAIGLMARVSAAVGVREAEAKERTRTADRTRLGQQLEDRCSQERVSNEQSLLKTGGQSGLATMQHIEADPYLGVAAHRFSQSRDLVNGNKALLQASRSERFAAYPEQMRELWDQRVELTGTLVMCGILASAVGVGFAVARFLPSPVGAVAGVATALLEARTWHKHGPRVIAPPVDGALKRVIQADIVREEPRLEERREAFEALREDTLQHYVRLLDSQPTGAPQKPPEVVRGEGEVIVGGISIPGRRGE